MYKHSRWDDASRLSKAQMFHVNNPNNSTLPVLIYLCLLSLALPALWLSGSPEDSSHIPSMRTWSLVLVGQRWPYSSSIVYICSKLRATWRTDTRHSSLFCLMTTQLRMEKWQESLENIIKLTTCSPLGQMITTEVYINYLKPQRKS